VYSHNKPKLHLARNQEQIDIMECQLPLSAEYSALQFGIKGIKIRS